MMSSDELKGVTIAPAASIRQAMEAIDVGAIAAVLVTDDVGKLLGVVTDGDIRRGLLRGMSMTDSIRGIISESPLVVAEGVSRANVMDLMTAHGVSQIPVVSSEGRLIGVHVMKRLLGGVTRPNWAVVMAGGRGRRLGSITETVPKPMVRVAGRPILERILLHLVGAGIGRIFLAVNYRAAEIEDYFGSGNGLGVKIEYLREDPSAPLGTAGALSMLPFPEHPVLVMNGDLVTQFSVDHLFKTHGAADAQMTVGTVLHRYTVPFGVVEIDDEHKVNGVAEKPMCQWEILGGIQILAPSVLELLQPKQAIDLPDLLALVIARGDKVIAAPLDGDWVDVGTPDDLLRASGR